MFEVLFTEVLLRANFHRHVGSVTSPGPPGPLDPDPGAAISGVAGPVAAAVAGPGATGVVALARRRDTAAAGSRCAATSKGF